MNFLENYGKNSSRSRIILSDGGHEKNDWVCSLLRTLLILGFHDHTVPSPELQRVSQHSLSPSQIPVESLPVSPPDIMAPL